jgi:hypothetical protein
VDQDPFADANPATIRRALRRRFAHATIGGFGTPLITEYPDEAAELVMSIVGEVIEAKQRARPRPAAPGRPRRRVVPAPEVPPDAIVLEFPELAR